MLPTFRDLHGKITLFDGKTKLVLTKEQFQSVEPNYSLPSGIIERILIDDRHIISDGKTKLLATDINKVTLLGYVSKISSYKQAFPELTMPKTSTINWIGFYDSLRGTDVFNHVLDVSSRSTKANTAFTLLFNTLTTTNIEEELKYSFFFLRETMQNQQSLADFNEDHLKFLKEKLEEFNFDFTKYYLDSESLNGRTYSDTQTSIE